MTCVSSPHFFVMINGKPKGYFSSKKGLRQGDPLSPCLFIMCMEILSRLLDEAAISERIHYHPRCQRIRLTHLVFADDLVIFIAPHLHSLTGLKSILDKFYSWSGLKVSFDKSEIFIAGILDLEIDSLTETLGIKKGLLLVRYLRVPLINGRLIDKDCAPLIEKITT